MRAWFRIASVILPLAVIAIGTIAGPTADVPLPQIPLHEQLFFVAVNWLFFAAPQVIWLAIARVFRFTPRVCDQGLAAADLVFLFFCILIFTTHGVLFWLFYLPLAFIASILAGGIARAANTAGLTKR